MVRKIEGHEDEDLGRSPADDAIPPGLTPRVASTLSPPPAGPHTSGWREYWASFEVQFGEGLRRFALAVLRSRVGPRAAELAEDGYQSFLLDLMRCRRLGVNGSIRDPVPFLQRALWNHLCDEYRRNRAHCRCARGSRLPLEWISNDVRPPEPTAEAAAWLCPAIGRAEQRLSGARTDRHRVIIADLRTRAAGGRTSPGLARRFGITQSALAQATYRARVALRRELRAAIYVRTSDPEIAEERWRWVKRQIRRQPEA